MARIATSFQATVLAGALALSIGLTGCAGGLGGETVAKIDGTIVTTREFTPILEQYRKLFQLSAGAGANNTPNPVIEETVKRMALNKLILSTLIKNDAQKLGVSVSDNDFKTFKNNQIQQSGGNKFFEEYLKLNNINESDFDNNLREQLLIERFLEKKGGASLKASDAEIKKYYDSHPTEFDKPESVKASHILLKVIAPEIRKELRAKNPKMTEDQLNAEVAKIDTAQKAKADQVFAQLKMTPNDKLAAQFAELAKKNSEDTISAKNGGDLGYMEQRVLDPVFWAAIAKAKPGVLYPDVVKTQFGYHIIEVHDHAAAHRMTLDEAKGAIADRLSAEKKQKLLETWIADKKSQAKISIEDKFKPMDPAQLQQQLNAATKGGAQQPPGQPAPADQHPPVVQSTTTPPAATATKAGHS
jgi:parvulin-like peptidyl-prolyl isomerase